MLLNAYGSSPHRLATVSLLAGCIAWSAAFTVAQDYQLIEPTGAVTANVFMRYGQMNVVDANGTEYRFVRDASFDSFDGRYDGYFLPSVNRVVRFPTSGNGPLQVADLDDFRPSYVHSRRRVRKFRGGHSHHRPGNPYLPPHFVSPSGPRYPYGGYPPYGYGYFSFGPTLHVGPPIFRPSFQSIVLESKVIPRQPLAPVMVNLQNPAGREVIVTVSDLRSASQSKQLRIPPGGTVPFLVERDAGADRVQTVLTYAPDGSQITRDLSTPIPPAPRYELTVHEWRLQSIAIDRTGKSPNVIEDTQFQGRGLGRFTLPPGDQITGGTIDVVRTAMQSENAGSVAPILDDTPSSPLRPVSPLEEMIQRQRAASGR